MPRKKNSPILTGLSAAACLLVPIFVGINLDERGAQVHLDSGNRARYEPSSVLRGEVAFDDLQPVKASGNFLPAKDALPLDPKSSYWQDGQLILKPSLSPEFSLSRVNGKLHFPSEKAFFELLFAGTKNGVYHLRISPKNCDLSFAVEGRDRIPVSNIPCSFHQQQNDFSLELDAQGLKWRRSNDAEIFSLPLAAGSSGYAGVITNLVKTEVSEIFFVGRLKDTVIKEQL